jgi:hypothetical protein
MHAARAELAVSLELTANVSSDRLDCRITIRGAVQHILPIVAVAASAQAPNCRHQNQWSASTAMTWREYHEATKHSVESLRRSRHVLDWANMPDPFRHYEGVPVLDLPADPPAPEMPALDVLLGTLGTHACA